MLGIYTGIATSLRDVKIHTPERLNCADITPGVDRVRLMEEFLRQPRYHLSGR